MNARIKAHITPFAIARMIVVRSCIILAIIIALRFV